MRETILFLLHYVLFNLHNILVDADKNAIFSLLTYLRLTQFSYTKISNFPDNFIPLHEICNFDTPILATFMTIFMFLIK